MSLLLLGALLAAAPAAAPSADSAIGTWKTETRGGVVEIQRCGPSICGRLVTSELLRTQPDLKDTKNSDPKLRNRPLKGLLLLSGFKADGDAWTGGSIYKADEGKTYKATVTPIDANTLKVRGCIFVPLCKTQTWTRLR
ncbi:DUF2147 domain-containing protein [Sphingomonas sp. MA1305]|uniref:DUF2147 domain-containing protein n=1 Tax=Sphingomonas sp. MA1305 TaxID=2479204 RepID=UPI0018DF23BD|nr:DUF2147 domain-containing protein [Sphingomonas sp. MA1305]MBI0474705.1 DUF2147 domain-containing protein [Sphingomonas sp. MA1305]